jgi:hypothetical protein
MERVLDSVLQTIANTLIVRPHRIARGPRAETCAKRADLEQALAWRLCGDGVSPSVRRWASRTH